MKGKERTMFIMNKDEVLVEIKKINEYIKKCSWMDFEMPL